MTTIRVRRILHLSPGRKTSHIHNLLGPRIQNITRHPINPYRHRHPITTELRLNLRISLITVLHE